MVWPWGFWGQIAPPSPPTNNQGQVSLMAWMRLSNGWGVQANEAYCDDVSNCNGHELCIAMDVHNITPFSTSSMGCLCDQTSCGISSCLPRLGCRCTMGTLMLQHFDSQPYGDISLPLGNLLPETREKILQGEYVDVFSVLYRAFKKKEKDG